MLSRKDEAAANILNTSGYGYGIKFLATVYLA